MCFKTLPNPSQYQTVDVSLQLIHDCEQMMGYTLEVLFYAPYTDDEEIVVSTSLQVDASPSQFPQLSHIPAEYAGVFGGIVDRILADNTRQQEIASLTQCQRTGPQRMCFPRSYDEPPLPACLCVDCFFTRVFCLRAIERVLATMAARPGEEIQTCSFSLSPQEIKDIKTGHLRCCAFLAERRGAVWHACKELFRIIVNGTRVSSLDDGVINLVRLIRPGVNKACIYGFTEGEMCLRFYLFSDTTVSQLVARFAAVAAPSEEEEKRAFVSLLRKEDDDVVVETEAFPFSLLDPLTLTRLRVPVRARSCEHVRCFDLESFLEMYSSSEEKPCPVCGKDIDPRDLVKDFYVGRILRETSEEEEVEMQPSGAWAVMEEKEEEEKDEPVDTTQLASILDSMFRSPHFGAADASPSLPVPVARPAQFVRDVSEPPSFSVDDFLSVASQLRQRQRPRPYGLWEPQEPQEPQESERSASHDGPNTPFFSFHRPLTQSLISSHFPVRRQPAQASSPPMVPQVVSPVVPHPWAQLPQSLTDPPREDRGQADIIDLASSSDSDDSEQQPINRRRHVIDDEDIIDIIDWSVCYKQDNPSTGMWRTSSEARRDWQSTTMHFEIE